MFRYMGRFGIYTEIGEISRNYPYSMEEPLDDGLNRVLQETSKEQKDKVIDDKMDREFTPISVSHPERYISGIHNHRYRD